MFVVEVLDLVVYIDSNEPKIAEVWFTSQGFNLELVRKPLDVGDYLISVDGREVPVERKDSGDFVASIEDGRLNNQLFYLSREYPISYIIVVGTISDALEYSNLSRRAYISALVGASLKRSPDGKSGQVITLTVETNFDFACAVGMIHRKLEDGDLYRRPKPIGNKSDYDSCLITLYSALPCISVKRAKALAEEFPSLESLMSASVEEIANVKGIGKKTAEKIYNFLHRL